METTQRFLLDCETGEPASDFCSVLDDELPSVFLALEATREEVCLLLVVMRTPKPKGGKRLILCNTDCGALSVTVYGVPIFIEFHM